MFRNLPVSDLRRLIEILAKQPMAPSEILTSIGSSYRPYVFVPFLDELFSTVPMPMLGGDGCSVEMCEANHWGDGNGDWLFLAEYEPYSIFNHESQFSIKRKVAVVLNDASMVSNVAKVVAKKTKVIHRLPEGVLNSKNINNARGRYSKRFKSKRLKYGVTNYSPVATFFRDACYSSLNRLRKNLTVTLYNHDRTRRFEKMHGYWPMEFAWRVNYPDFKDRFNHLIEAFSRIGLLKYGVAEEWKQADAPSRY